MGSDEYFTSDVVELMRGDVAVLASAPEHRTRFLMRVASGFDRLFRQLGEGLDLTPNDVSACLALWDGGRCSMAALARRIDLTPPTITSMVDRLEAKGFIARYASAFDRRRVELFVTPRFERALWEQLGEFGSRISEPPGGALEGVDWAGLGAAGALVRSVAIEEADRLAHERRYRRRGLPDEPQPGMGW